MTARWLVLVLVFVLGICGPSPLHAQERPPLDKVKLGQRELALLKSLDRLAKNHRDTVFILAVTPFVQLLESPDPLNWLFTVTTSDWDKIVEAASGMKRITACASETEFVSFYSEYAGTKMPNRAFWDEMRRLHSANCK